MEDGVRIADVSKELVPEPFSLARPFDQACDVNDVDRCRDGALRMTEVRKDFKPPVRNIGGTEVGIYGAEREIGALGLPGTDAIEERGFADVGQSHDTAFKGHKDLFFTDTKIAILFANLITVLSFFSFSAVVLVTFPEL
jgi:hypothetical protein